MKQSDIFEQGNRETANKRDYATGKPPLSMSLRQSRNELQENVTNKMQHESDNQTSNKRIIEEMIKKDKKGYRTERKIPGGKTTDDPVRMQTIFTLSSRN